jgi:hypothetical protein
VDAVEGKGKVVPMLLTEHDAVKAYWWWRYSFTHSLTSALDGGVRSASSPSRFTPSERAPGTHWIGGWVGPRAVLDAAAAAKRKINSKITPSSPIIVHSLVTYQTSASRFAQ